MSEFTAIRAVSLTLRALLEEHITNSTDPQLAGVAIDLRSPKEMREANEAMGISLWLYRVTRNGHTLNQPPERIAPNQLKPHPLPVNLYYLVTPITQNPEDEQALLGRVLQVLNDHVILRGSDLRDTLQGGTEELRLTLETLSLEELTRVWDALKESYQLSVPYLVQVVTIDSDHEPVQAGPVVVKETEYKHILSVT
ncbi:MAG: DUF4255 domain-containing protein [Anaerolineae bacterium]